MGANFLVSYVTIDEKREPDWKAAERRVMELGATPLGDWPPAYLENQTSGVLPNTGENALVEAFELASVALTADLEYLKHAWGGGARLGARQGAKILVGNKLVMLAGGLSWGDSPCELSDSIERLIDAGVTKAAGFDW